MRVRAHTPCSSVADARLPALRVSGRVRLPLGATLNFFLVLNKCIFTLVVFRNATTKAKGCRRVLNWPDIFTRGLLTQQTKIGKKAK